MGQGHRRPDRRAQVTQGAHLTAVGANVGAEVDEAVGLPDDADVGAAIDADVDAENVEAVGPPVGADVEAAES